jgi:hypothetical protein
LTPKVVSGASAVAKGRLAESRWLSDDRSYVFSFVVVRYLEQGRGSGQGEGSAEFVQHLTAADIRVEAGRPHHDYLCHFNEVDFLDPPSHRGEAIRSQGQRRGAIRHGRPGEEIE